MREGNNNQIAKEQSTKIPHACSAGCALVIRTRRGACWRLLLRTRGRSTATTTGNCRCQPKTQSGSRTGADCCRSSGCRRNGQAGLRIVQNPGLRIDRKAGFRVDREAINLNWLALSHRHLTDAQHGNGQGQENRFHNILTPMNMNPPHFDTSRQEIFQFTLHLQHGPDVKCFSEPSAA